MAEIARPTSITAVPPPQRHIFISHSEHDLPIALDIVQTLEADFFKCWIAHRDIPPGSTWMGAIVDAIVASQMMVVVVSAHSQTSKHVLREVTIADDEKVPFVPFCIDNSTMSKDFRFFFSTAQRLDALGHSMTSALASLRESVAKRLRP
jgi:hypothetical protein